MLEFDGAYVHMLAYCLSSGDSQVAQVLWRSDGRGAREAERGTAQLSVPDRAAPNLPLHPGHGQCSSQ